MTMQLITTGSPVLPHPSHRRLNLWGSIGAGSHRGLHPRALEVEAEAPVDDLHMDVRSAVLVSRLVIQLSHSQPSIVEFASNDGLSM